MESIKEKAENRYPDKKVVLARGNTCLSCGRVKRESFEAGANYVLDLLIEEDDKYDTVMECYPALTRIIRELKSNQ